MDYLSFLLEFTWFLTTTISPVSNSLIILPLLCRSLCLSILSYTRMLNSSLCLNISGNSASKWSKSFCPHEVPSLDLYGNSSIENGNSLPIATTDWEILVPSTGPVFQAYNAKHSPWNHCWSLPLSSEFIFWALFKYLWDPSFLTDFWFLLANAFTGASRVSWKFFLDIPKKSASASKTIILEDQMGQASFWNPIVRPGMV